MLHNCRWKNDDKRQCYSFRSSPNTKCISHVRNRAPVQFHSLLDGWSSLWEKNNPFRWDGYPQIYRIDYRSSWSMWIFANTEYEIQVKDPNLFSGWMWLPILFSFWVWKIQGGWERQCLTSNKTSDISEENVLAFLCLYILEPNSNGKCMKENFKNENSKYPSYIPIPIDKTQSKSSPISNNLHQIIESIHQPITKIVQWFQSNQKIPK